MMILSDALLVIIIAVRLFKNYYSIPASLDSAVKMQREIIKLQSHGTAPGAAAAAVPGVQSVTGLSYSDDSDD
jgi:hypothetical protein